MLKALAAEHPNVRYVSFSRNFGKEAAIYAGLKYARGEHVALMDADLQDPPSYLPQMYEALQTGEYDNVATRRSTREGEPAIRSFFSRMFYRLINKMADVPIVDGARDFRMMKRKMVDAILAIGEYNRFSKGLFSWVGFRTLWLSYDNVERVAGQTKWSFWKLFKYSLEGIINFSHTPLDIVTNAGMLMTVIAFIWAAVLILKKLIIGNYNVSGWTSLICIIIFLGGIQLCSIGIIGQYIARIFLETKHRPLFIVAESSDDERAPED
jgi:glycosyltransferase involved in cell wall biosynthesis